MTAVTDDRIEAIRTAATLRELAAQLGVDTVHEAYFQAKDAWWEVIAREQANNADPDGLPGTCVEVDGHEFHIHGITHADTPEEREFLRDHASAFLDRDASIYCEQGIRPMYFADFGAVREMDDYRWAMQACAELDGDSYVDELLESSAHGVLEDIASMTAAFREATFSLIESGQAVYGERFERALGDVAADFTTSHADLAVGESYASFTLSREASRNPDRLHELQQYYERAFLPQPLEREWLRRHDHELEIVSHARNERMADYAVYHTETTEEIHLIVGAAHQPGIAYYLKRYRDGAEQPDQFEPVVNGSGGP